MALLDGNKFGKASTKLVASTQKSELLAHLIVALSATETLPTDAMGVDHDGLPDFQL
jgi:hypothetical protein